MKVIRRLSRLQILMLLISVPLAAWAVTWSMNGHTTPKVFRQAAAALGLRVTQACRPYGASIGARGSLHKSCRAMDIAAATPRAKVQALRKYGLCAQWHVKGFFGATANHWHVVQCSTSASRATARQEQQRRVQDIRRQNSGHRTQGARTQQQRRVADMRNQNVQYWIDYWANFWKNLRAQQSGATR